MVVLGLRDLLNVQVEVSGRQWGDRPIFLITLCPLPFLASPCPSRVWGQGGRAGVFLTS